MILRPIVAEAEFTTLEPGHTRPIPVYDCNDPASMGVEDLYGRPLPTSCGCQGLSLVQWVPMLHLYSCTRIQQWTLLHRRRHRR